MKVEILKLAVWNANGLCQHAQELQSFLQNNEIDVMLISETRFTNKSHIKIWNYSIYHTNHPDGTAHGGTAIIVKNGIKHHELDKYTQEYLQATTIEIAEKMNIIKLSAIYCPPKHNNKKEHYGQFFRTLGARFIAGGDYNAKNVQWGSRLTTTKGRELLAAMTENKLDYVSTGQPTYWPSDRRKVPDLLDFCVTKGVNMRQIKATASLDLSSDHTPIIVTMYSEILHINRQPTLCNKQTNWEIFEEQIEELIDLQISLKTTQEIDQEVCKLTKAIQKAAWAATPEQKTLQQKNKCPIIIKQKIAEKRKLRQRWQNTRMEADKKMYNKAAKDLKKLLLALKNQYFQEYLEGLSPTETTDYSLWKATRRIKRPRQHIPPIRRKDGTWARNNEEKASGFAEHLEDVFKPFDSELTLEEENEIHRFLEEPPQVDIPINKVTLSEIKGTIQKEINPKKAPGFDLITGKLLKKLPEKGLKCILYIFNASLRLGYFPIAWKVAQIIMLPKPGKKIEEITSYRPISLLPILSKVFEKLILTRLKPVIEERKITPDHQFGFRHQHSTIEQIHRVVKKINNDIEEKRYCCAVFLDISQAFDKVWHEGMCYKLKKYLPYNYYKLLKSYLSDRHFFIQQYDVQTTLKPIISGVPQGSVLGPMLYLIYTADLPQTNQTTVATFADDTALLSSHTDCKIATRNLQINLDQIQSWLKKWRMKANEDKSVQVTFTTRRENCPPVTLNGKQLKHAEQAKYLGMHLDRRMTWKVHILNKRKQLGLKLKQMYWMMGRKSQLTMENKLLIYKTILKPVWTYGVQLWGTASNSNIEKIQKFQNKVLRTIVDAPWYVTNSVIHRDLNVPTVKEVIKSASIKYSERIAVHPNKLVDKLMDTQDEARRLKRFKPSDLPSRFVN